MLNTRKATQANPFSQTSEADGSGCMFKTYSHKHETINSMFDTNIDRVHELCDPMCQRYS